MAPPKPQSGESIWSLAMFWLVAFSAALLFGAVLIAPEWEQRQLLRSRACHLAAQCKYLDDRNNYLERVVEAFRHDPDFNNEIARCELDYGQVDEQRLTARPPTWKRPEPPHPQPVACTGWAPLVQLFAQDRLVRQAALVTAAVFAVVGLAFFNPTLRSPVELND